MSSAAEARPADSGAVVADNVSPAPASEPAIGVFVHLAHDKDEQSWRRAWANGTLVGRNDITPYGYGRAEAMGCSVKFSHARRENIAQRVLRLGARVILGFDLVHAIHQRDEIFRSEVVWTHTESQFLAVATLLMMRRNGPRLIGQSVWLFDSWPHLWPIRRALYRFLISRVDVLTTHSNANAEIARSLFADKRIEMVHFGLTCDDLGAPDSGARAPASIVAVGNDRHRDWKTLIAAVNDLTGVDVDILSHTALKLRRLARPHVRLWRPKTNDQLRAAYAGAAVAVVPLTENVHASGITAILEAVLAGVPVIASDVGGLRSYFGDNEIVFVPAGDADALRAAITRVISQREASFAMAARAQARVLQGPANVETYIRRHVEISRELVRGGSHHIEATQP